MKLISTFSFPANSQLPHGHSWNSCLDFLCNLHLGHLTDWPDPGFGKEMYCFLSYVEVLVCCNLEGGGLGKGSGTKNCALSYNAVPGPKLLFNWYTTKILKYLVLLIALLVLLPTSGKD